MSDNSNQTATAVQKFFETRSIKRISKDGVNQNFNIVNDDNNVLSDGVTVSCWKNHLCFSGAYGTCVFKVSGTSNLLDLFSSESISAEYAKEKMVASSFNDDSQLEFAVGIIKHFAQSLNL
ncbi:hypothetical protein [uncultured Psychrobacter sp.]|uniref:hypothetical protein n=1 Tax=uncultured Psychrobacter sp. TaxID=259303 RepID=UPI0030DC455E